MARLERMRRAGRPARHAEALQGVEAQDERLAFQAAPRARARCWAGSPPLPRGERPPSGATPGTGRKLRRRARSRRARAGGRTPPAPDRAGGAAGGGEPGGAARRSACRCAGASSCPPPSSWNAENGVRARRYSAPIPFGPPTLCAENDAASTSHSRPRRRGIFPKAWVASMWESAPCGMRDRRQARRTGSTLPSSEFASLNGHEHRVGVDRLPQARLRPA